MSSRRIRRRLPMWEIHGARLVHWKRVSAWRDEPWAQVRARHRHLLPGATWFYCGQGRDRFTVKTEPGRGEQCRRDLAAMGFRVLREFVVPRRG